MKLFFWNDKLNELSNNGSSTTASRELNLAAQQLGFYSDFNSAEFIIYLDSLDTGKRFPNKKTIPYLISEYNIAPALCVQNLLKDKPLCLAISSQTRDSFINAGYPEELIKVVHLGFNPKAWPNLNQRARKFGDPLIYLTINTSNQRSAFEIFVPAFLEFARGKNVKLIIKDQQNDNLARLIAEIDRDKQIIYEGKNLPYEKLVYLMAKCHIHCYVNSTTSFGMTVGDTALAGLPQIISKSSALIEFTSEDTVTYVDCYEQEVGPLLQAEWNAFGLKNNLLPLNHFNGPLLAPRPKYQSILNALEYSYTNHEKNLAKNQKFCQYIGEKFTWHHSVKKIVNILKDK